MANFTSVSSPLPIGVLTTLLTFNITLSFTASLGNILILSTLYKVSCLHPVTKLLLQCLATIDLCVGLFLQPLFVAVLVLHIDLGNTNLDMLYHVEEVAYISSFVLCGLSVLTSTAISVDRLLVLLLRLRYKEIVTLKRAQAVILSCWVMAVSCGLVRVWSHTVSEIVVFVVGLVALVTSMFCYVKIHLRLQRNQAKVEDSLGEGQSNDGEGAGTKATTGARRIAEEEKAKTREDEVGATEGAERTEEEEEEEKEEGATTGAGRTAEEEEKARAREDGVGATKGAERTEEEEKEKEERATTRAGRTVEEEGGGAREGVGPTTGAGRTAGEIEAGGTRGGATEKSGAEREAKVSPKPRIQGGVRLNMTQYKKVVSGILWLQLTLVACYAPFIIVSLLGYTVLSGATIRSLKLFTATLIYLNSSLNPFLYCWKIREVRKTVKKVAKAFCCRL